ncbi:uncharacterized protein [Anoplolepis gracilipes]|uniref:uncharacterized protein n=1 Tax=Anoplolepis gracilipes TaxID=354296 RepID=UPI003B9E53E1
MKALAQFSAGMEMLLNLLIFKLKSAHIQNLLKEIEDFLLNSNDIERTILQKYTNRYFCFSVFVVICHCSVAIAFSCGPIFLSNKFPLEGWYPFSTESPIIICIIYFTQVYIVVQAAFHFIKQPLWVSSQFIFMVICGSQRLFITALTADDLIENSKNVAMEMYNILWFEKSRYNTKDICFMIQRSQIPLEISIRGLMPTLSLEYFAKYHVAMLSYFTAMRAIIGD